MIKRTLLCALLFVGAGVLCSVRVAAQGQTQAQPPSQQGERKTSTEDADLAITANVTAKELRFEVVPNPKVEFTGKPERETVWEAERDNLPRPVQPGVTYRNIGIRLKITSIFPDIDRIVSEALGEVPATDKLPEDDNAKPPPAPAPTTPPPTTTPPPPPRTQQPEGRP